MKRWITGMLSVIMLSVGLPCTAVFAKDSGSVSDLQIGDYIQFGSYLAAPVIWRYVADDEYGKLMLSDKVICVKVYDTGKDSPGYGSHHRRWTIHGETSDTQNSNYWGDSNIRSWLNSKASERAVKWLCGMKPVYTYMDEEGFLSDAHFSPLDRAAIKKVHQKNLLDAPDVQRAEGGSLKYWKRTHDPLLFVQKYYDKVSYEYVDDMMFLPDDRQLYHVWENRSILGDTYLWTEMTPQAAEQEKNWVKTTAKGIIHPSDFTVVGDGLLREGYQESDGTYPTDLSCSYFLRTPDTTPIPSPYSKFYLTGDYVRRMPKKPEGEVRFDESAINAYHLDGIRPAFYLNEDNVQILSGSGTIEKPYQITGIQAPPDGKDGAIEGVPVKPRPEISIYINEKRGYDIDSPRYDPVIDHGTIYVTRPWAKDMFGLRIESKESNQYDIRQSIDAETVLCFRISCNDTTVREVREENQYATVLNVLEDATWEDAPMEKNGYFYLPLVSLAEFLGYTTKWSDDQKTVTLTRDETGMEEPWDSDAFQKLFPQA